jgi:hypothetical protein
MFNYQNAHFTMQKAIEENRERAVFVIEEKIRPVIDFLERNGDSVSADFLDKECKNGVLVTKLINRLESLPSRKFSDLVKFVLDVALNSTAHLVYETKSVCRTIIRKRASTNKRMHLLRRERVQSAIVNHNVPKKYFDDSDSDSDSDSETCFQKNTCELPDIKFDKEEHDFDDEDELRSSGTLIEFDGRAHKDVRGFARGMSRRQSFRRKRKSCVTKTNKNFKPYYDDLVVRRK